MAVKNTEKAQQAAEAAEAKNTTPEAEKPQEAPQEAAEQVTLVYVGPSLPKGRLKQNSIFVGTRQEIEKELETVLESFPLVKNMLVPVSKLAEAKNKVKSSGSVLHKYYADMVSLISAAVNKEEMED